MLCEIERIIALGIGLDLGIDNCFGIRCGNYKTQTKPMDPFPFLWTNKVTKLKTEVSIYIIAILETKYTI